jgi:hypothetical protein
MNKKRAYCCLNCSNLPPCDPFGRNCPSCCAQCSSLDLCSSNAYFANGLFWKDFKYEANSWEETRMDIGGADNPDYRVKSFVNSTYDTRQSSPCCIVGFSNYHSEPNGEFYDGQTTYNCKTTDSVESYEDCEDCPHRTNGPSSCPIGAALFTKGSDVPADCPGWEHYTYDPNSGVVSCQSPETCYYMICVEDYPGSCIGDSTIFFWSRIEFFNPVNLYNYLGQDVGNIVDASYDPCNPTRTWSAPGCHFFHP